jgi:hypothetical protein
MIYSGSGAASKLNPESRSRITSNNPLMFMGRIRNAPINISEDPITMGFLNVKDIDPSLPKELCIRRG